MEAKRAGHFSGSFGEMHFGSAELGDARRTRRLVKTADLLMNNPSGSLPQRLQDWGNLMGLYRLSGSAAVTHQALLAAHRQTALAAMRQCPVVLILHDDTELDYTANTPLAQHLNPIGNGSRRGYICHNSLAITPQRQVLGLPSQILHQRRQVPKGESPQAKRQHPDRESRLWLKGCEAIGPASEGSLWVDIADRGAETFEFLEYEHRTGRNYLIRCAKDRNLDGEDHLGLDRIHRKLKGYLRDLPVLGRRVVEVSNNQGRNPRSGRVAAVSLRAGAVRIAVPHFARGQCQERSLDLWAIEVAEIDPPAGHEPLEWILLTNLPAETLEQASQRVDWYSCRMVVEELHRGMKSGAGVEKLGFERPERVEPVIGLLSVVSAMLLDLRQLARDPQCSRLPATAVVPKLWVQVLSGWRHGQVREDLTVLEFVMALGKLGGHLNRKGDGLPGWITLWRGWVELAAMVRGAEAIRKPRCV